MMKTLWFKAKFAKSAKFSASLHLVLKDSIPNSGLRQAVADNVDALALLMTQVSTDNCMIGTHNTIKG